MALFFTSVAPPKDQTQSAIRAYIAGAMRNIQLRRHNL